MSKEIVVANGLFSKLTISLNEETINKLAMIPKEDNPLKAVEQELQAVLDRFERLYFEMNRKDNP